MLTPILRLIVIYLVLAGAVLAVFNRDRVIPLLFGGDVAAVQAPDAASAPATAPKPSVQPAAAPPAPSGAAPLSAPTAAPLTAPTAAPAQPPASSTAAPDAEPAPATPAAAPAASQDPDALAEAVNAARQAFWQGDRAGAEAQLIALTKAHPNNADLFGELGNLELSIQAWDRAGTAYHQAALLLIAQGRRPQVMALMPILQTIAPDKAADLGARLQNR